MGSKYYLFQRHILGQLRLCSNWQQEKSRKKGVRYANNVTFSNLSLKRLRRKCYQLNRLMLLYIQTKRKVIRKHIHTHTHHRPPREDKWYLQNFFYAKINALSWVGKGHTTVENVVQLNNHARRMVCWLWQISVAFSLVLDRRRYLSGFVHRTTSIQKSSDRTNRSRKNSK